MWSKIKTAIWYLKNPKLLPDAFLKIKTFLFYSVKENSGEKSKLWCSANAVTQDTAFEQLFPGQPFEKIEKKFPIEYKYAIEQEAKSPFKMGGPGAIDLLYNFCEATQSRKVLETGVAYGWSTLAILLSLTTRSQTTLFSVDMPYAKKNNVDFVGTVILNHLKNKWNLIRESDYTGVLKAIRQLKEIDLCHYDSDKSYLGRKRSYRMIWRALKNNGLFISDDVSDNLGFKDFCESIDRTPIIVHWNNKYIGILKK